MSLEREIEYARTEAAKLIDKDRTLPPRNYDDETRHELWRLTDLLAQLQGFTREVHPEVSELLRTIREGCKMR